MTPEYIAWVLQGARPLDSEARADLARWLPPVPMAAPLLAA